MVSGYREKKKDIDLKLRQLLQEVRIKIGKRDKEVQSM